MFGGINMSLLKVKTVTRSRSVANTIRGNVCASFISNAIFINNSVNYNVMLIEGSEMPDVENGNLILAAHRGNSSVSFFDKLYKLKMGAEATVTYQNKNYTYNLVESYTVPKTGKVTIRRNGEVNTLTLITCTRNDKKTQTVFIFELSNIE